MWSLAFQPNNITLLLFESRELGRKLGSKRKGISGRLEEIHIEEFRDLLSSPSRWSQGKLCVTNMRKIFFRYMKARDSLEVRCADGKIILSWVSQMKHQLDATLCRFYFCRVTLHVSGASAHHQEYLKLVKWPLVHVFCKLFCTTTRTSKENCTERMQPSGTIRHADKSN